MMQKSSIEFPPGPSSHIPGKIVRSFVKDPINTLSKIEILNQLKEKIRSTLV